MESSFRASIRWRDAAIVTAVWTVLALAAASEGIVYRVYTGYPTHWVNAVGRSLLDWYTCGIFTPFVLVFARRFPVTRLRNLPLHVVAFALYCAGKYALYIPTARAFGIVRPGRSDLDLMTAALFAMLMVYAGIIAAGHGVQYYRKFLERDRAAHRLEAQLARVQLDALRAQLHPHFMFNTLNALSVLVHEDPDAADRMIVQLGDLLRQVMDPAAPQQIPLSQEIAFTEQYLSIMRVRMGDRLQTHINVSPAAMKAYVPNLLLQPLVENAFRHGFSKRTDSGKLKIEAYIVNEELFIDITDDGPGLSEPGLSEPQERLGLGNTRQRLQQLFGSGASLELSPAPGTGTGTRASCRLPVRHSAPSLATA